MNLGFEHAVASQMCANCGHEHLFGDYSYTQLQECGVVLHSSGKVCNCETLLPLTQIQRRKEGDLIPMGMSVTETDNFWYVRNRVSEDEYMLMKIPHFYDGTRVTFELRRRADERAS